MATTLFSVKADAREWEKGGAETKFDATVIILTENGEEINDPRQVTGWSMDKRRRRGEYDQNLNELSSEGGRAIHKRKSSDYHFDQSLELSGMF